MQDNEKVVNITVDKITWHQDSDGFLVGTIHFESEDFQKLTKAQFKSNSIEFGHTTKFNKFKVKEGSTIHYTMRKEKFGQSMVVDGVDNVGYEEFPKNCYHCGSPFAMNTFEFHSIKKNGMCCSSVLCISKSFTSLYRLGALCAWSMEFNSAREYFHSFTDNQGTHLGANDLYTFMVLFKQVGPKNTQAREKILREHFGKRWEQVYNFECNLEAKIVAGFSRGEFWYLAAIPGVNNWVTLNILNPKDLNSTAKAEFGATSDMIALQSVLAYEARWTNYLKVIPLRETIV